MAGRDVQADAGIVYVSRAQQRLWLADQLTPDSTGYLGNVFLRLRGEVDTRAVGSALRAVVERHDVLRTSLVERDGELIGVLRPGETFELEVENVDPDDLDAALQSEATTAVDLAAGLPIRARLLRVGHAEHVLCLGIHHAAADRGSLDALYGEFAVHYRRLTGADEAEPPNLTQQYRDIAFEFDSRHDTGELSPLISQQRAALADREAFELPPDRPRPAVRVGTGKLCHSFELPADSLVKLTEIGRSRAASLYMVLLAACHAVLYRHTGRTDVTTGTSASTREDADGAAAIGPHFTMLVLPGDVSGDPTFAELLDRVRDVALDAYESRRLAFDSLVNELAVPRDPGRTPLFQILVDLATPVRLPVLPGIEVTEILTPGSGAKYDLTIEFRPRDKLEFSVEWDSALYEPDTVMRLMDHLGAALAAVAEDPRIRVDDLPVLSPAEAGELRKLAEPARVPLPALGLHDLFVRQAARTPDAVAVRDESATCTYADLERRSAAIASGLVALGVGPDVPVGVLLEQSIELVCALFGILRAGGAYVPVDPEAPTARTQAILATSGAPVCLVPRGRPSPASSGRPEAAAGIGCRTLDLDAVLATSARFDGGAHPLPQVHPDNLCSIYFTSGSTGEPKGVASTHRGWVGQMANLQERYALSPGDSLLLKTPLTFDDVAREIFWPLMIGATTVALPPGSHRDPRALLAAAITYRTPWLQFVPGMLALFLDDIEPGHLTGLTGLRHLVSDGDRLPPRTVEAFFRRLGGLLGCRLNNHWGTTEVSIDSTHHVCTRADAADSADAVPLGEPMENHEVYVLDHNLGLVPRGTVGELCISGIGLARGYLGEPGRTARAFVPHPFRPGERLYRTGDTARLRHDGALVYRGRRDHQVKVRGVRVELGEVEAAVRAFPGVADTVAATWQPAPGDRRIVAYVTVTDRADAGAGQQGAHGDRDAGFRTRLRAHLAATLPQAAVPSALMLLDALPRNPSGKVDRRSLPSPDLASASDESFVPLTTDLERAVAEIWSSVLGVARLGANDDFFAVGGHSLLVIRAVNRMRDAFAIEVPVRLVFERPTVRAAATAVEDAIIADLEGLSDDEAERLAAAPSVFEGDGG